MIAAGYRLVLCCPECGGALEHLDGTPGAELLRPLEACHQVAASSRCTECKTGFDLTVVIRPDARAQLERARRAGAADAAGPTGMSMFS